MEDEIYRLLEEYGLDKTEISIYLCLVDEDELTAYRISQKTKIHRSTCYDILERLISKGFVSKFEKEGFAYYSFNELSRVISSLKDKETILLNLMPKVAQIEKKQESRLKVLEGAEGQKQFNFNLFNLAKEKKITFCYILGNTYASNLSSNIFIERLLREAKKFKIEYRGIWNEKYRNDKIIKQYINLGKNKFLDLPSVVGTIIYDNHIAFLYTSNQPQVIEIKNRLVSEEMKSYFIYLWRLAKE